MSATTGVRPGTPARPARGRTSAAWIRTTLVALAGLAGLLGPAGPTACGGDDPPAAAGGAATGAGDPSPSGAATGSTGDPTGGTTPGSIAPGPTGATTTEPAAVGARRYAVGVTERTFVDADRGRTLRVRLLYPGRGPRPSADPGAEVPITTEATPADGPFPLVLFAHGYRLPGDGYDRMLAATAAHGYVVAAPDFPGTSARGGTGNRSDIANQPADLSFVADQVVALGGDGGRGPSPSTAPAAPIPSIAHPDRLAVAGHSDGGLTATATGYNRTYRDPRVRAVASFTGGIGLFGGAYDAPDPAPLLLVHGTGDGTNPFSASVGARDALAAPSWLVAVDGGDHMGPYMFGTGRPDLGDALAAFLDASLEGDAAGLDRLATVVATGPGLALVP